jgi:putative ABC transport system ATP-binding protein
VIELADVVVDYGTAMPLAGVSVTLAGGGTAVVGPSGSGKSTLLRVIAGTQTPTRGSVTVDGRPVRRASWATPSDARVAMVHQDYRLVPFLTVRENVLLAAELRGVPCDAAAVEAGLLRVMLEPELADRMPSTLSGGQQQRVAIARALAAGASVIVADEPTGALDVENTRRVADILATLGERDGLTVVVATHDPSVASRMQQCLALDGGALKAAVG